MKQVAGRTLIAWACSVAANTPGVAHVAVSTDDKAMGTEALAHGAHEVIQRPTALATDEATAADTWQHAWRHAESTQSTQFDVSVWLQPTSPTRTVDDIERTIARLTTTSANSCVTVSPVPGHFAPAKQLTVTEDGRLSPLVPGRTPNSRRQQLDTTYWLNGHCYAARREPFLTDGVVITADAVPIIIERPTANIDDHHDLDFARWLLGNNHGPRPEDR